MLLKSIVSLWGMLLITQSVVAAETPTQCGIAYKAELLAYGGYSSKCVNGLLEGFNQVLIRSQNGEVWKYIGLFQQGKITGFFYQLLWTDVGALHNLGFATPSDSTFLPGAEYGVSLYRGKNLPEDFKSLKWLSYYTGKTVNFDTIDQAIDTNNHQALNSSGIKFIDRNIVYQYMRLPQSLEKLENPYANIKSVLAAYEQTEAKLGAKHKLNQQVLQKANNEHRPVENPNLDQLIKKTLKISGAKQ